MDKKALAYEFLEKYNATSDNIQTDKLLNSFTLEMEKALKGQDSSLQMAPAFIDTYGSLCADKCICIDAGGTNLRVALVSFDEHLNENVEYFKKYEIPGKNKEVDADEFFDIIAGYLLPIINESDYIGFSFAFVAENMSNKDAKIIEFAKEVKVINAKEKLVAKELLKALARKGVESEKHITVLNDTVGVLLSGRSLEHIDSDYTGFILGTGTNTSIMSKETRVTKLNLNENSNIVLNIESGRFDKLKKSFFEEIIDKESTVYGDHVFEKMVAGEYTGKLVTQILLKAYEEGFISKTPSSLTTKEVSDFMKNYEASSDSGDSAFIYYIIKEVKKRIVKLIGINLLAVCIMSKKLNGKNKVIIMAEGSTFTKFYRLKEDVITFLNDELTLKRGIQFEIVCLKNSMLIGCAIAGLIN